MKKIVIVTRRMILGGIEKALISMLKSIPEDKYEITVLVMGKGGELEEEIPNYIKLDCLYGNEKTTLEKIWKNTRKGKLIAAIKIAWFTLLSKMTKSIFKQEWYHSKMLPKSKIYYDLAIAYHVPASFPVVFVMNNIKAKSKIAWIHSDVSKYKEQLRLYQEFYEKYDKIYCVSKEAMEKFNNIYPHLHNKTSVFYNIIDTQQVEELASREGGFYDEFDGLRILTVGRLTKEKGHDIIPGVLTRLSKEGKNIRWYLIGDGDCRSELENLIMKYRLKDKLILLGQKINPYPYIKQCDIYVQPSRHEGYCITLAEARVLNKPIITTDFAGSREQIVNGHNGLIIKFDENEMYMAIKTLIYNRNLSLRFTEKLKKTNIMDLNQLERLLESV
ncbi:glycosyltransferase [Bacillus sp. FJAT-49732]|uniref:Glycosyltransferase n=1 Tax=Lederbergia citrisecunda TaxID=2833583 RepID=A0A942TJT6_9BACI|nr:glycosyltransferase [Lederbergia citrisecunda]MBS4198418.1 glycosyltransferase [Lederbergia citrisecunda]